MEQSRVRATSRVARVRVWARDPGVRLVDVEGRGTFRVDAGTVDALALAEGTDADAHLVERIAEAAAVQEGRRTALRLLQRRLRSRAELERALRRRGVSALSLPGIMADLMRAGWIDDARFARAWIRDRLALRPSGRRRLRVELMIRGVPAHVADHAISATLPEGAEEELAQAQAKARFRRFKALSPPVARRRLIGWLKRRGFGADAIARALRGLERANVEQEDDDVPA